MEADYSLLDNKLNISRCEVKLADGVVYINGDINFAKGPPFFNVKLIAQGVNIGSISEDWGNSKGISGILSSEANLSGEWGKPTTYLGKGKVEIKEGTLGKIGLIGRIITFSPLAALSGDLSLTTLEGDFNILEGYASTENTIIKGPGVKITATGDVGWNKKLDFVLGLYASSELLKGTQITKLLGILMDDFGNALRKIKLTGTIDNPEFVIVPLGIGDAIIEGLQKSFNRVAPLGNTP